MFSCVIDVGSPKKGKLGWACAGADGNVETGSDLDAAIGRVASRLPVEAVALGFEAPMFVPARHALLRLTDARAGEGTRPWSAGAGCGALATGLAIVTYTLGRLREAVPNASASLNWRTFEPIPRHLLLFEAFVSGGDKGDTHVADAAAAVRCLAAYSTLWEIESALGDDGPVLSMLGAALLRTGWSSDTDILAESCLVVRPSIVATMGTSRSSSSSSKPKK